MLAGGTVAAAFATAAAFAAAAAFVASAAFAAAAAFTTAVADLLNRSLDLFNRSIDLFNRSVDLFNRSIDLFNRSTDLFNRSIPATWLEWVAGTTFPLAGWRRRRQCVRARGQRRCRQVAAVSSTSGAAVLPTGTSTGGRRHRRMEIVVSVAAIGLRKGRFSCDFGT